MNTNKLLKSIYFNLFFIASADAAEKNDLLQVEAEESTSLKDLPHGRPFWSVLQGLSLVQIYNLAKSQTGYWNSPGFWEDVAYVNRPYIRDGKAAAQIAQYMQTNFSAILENGGSALIHPQILDRIDTAYTPGFAKGVGGFLMFMAGDCRGGMTLLEMPGTVVTEGMQRLLNVAAWYGYLGFVGQLEQDRQAYLQRIANAGGPGAEHAQETLNYHGAYLGPFGFIGQTEEDRHDYLQGIVDKGGVGAEDAQKWINYAAYNGNLKFATQTKDVRQAYLQSIVDRGGIGAKDAQEQLNYAAYRGELGFYGQTEDVRQLYLESIVGRGGVGAESGQMWINHAAYLGSLKFSTQTEEARQAYLQGIVDRGRVGAKDAKDAQEKLNDAIYDGELTFKDRTVLDPIAYLQYIVATRGPGAKHAQEKLNDAAYDDAFDFTQKIGLDPMAYLQGIVGSGGLGAAHAQEKLNDAAKARKLGFTKKPGVATSGDDYLLRRATAGDKHAQTKFSQNIDPIFVLYNAIIGVDL